MHGAALCAATWPIVNFSAVSNFALYIIFMQHWIQGGSENNLKAQLHGSAFGDFPKQLAPKLTSVQLRL